MPHPSSFVVNRRKACSLPARLVLVAVISLTAETLLAADVCDTPQFAAARTVSAGPFNAFAKGVATGDFNDDGIPDLAVANLNADGVSVLLATVPGWYAPAVTYAVGAGLNDVAVGDFNGNGLLDLAVASIGNYSVLPGNGDGTFGEPILSPSGAAGGFGKLASGDFNGDGRLDLAHKSGGLRALLGNGDGTFTVSANLDPANPDGNFVVVDDIDGDGRRDLVTVGGGNLLRVLKGNGDGTFQPPGSVSVPSSPIAVAVGDFNEDGKRDLVSVNNGAGNISVLLGDGAGGFNNVTNIVTGTAPYVAVAGDLNGDGHIDIAVANQSGNSLSIVLGAGDGTFLEPIQHDVTNPVGLLLADFDLDGVPDLVTGISTGGSANGIWLMRGLGDGRFWAGPPKFSTGGGPQALASADFNGDDLPDLVVMNGGKGALAILLNQGDETFVAGDSVTFPSNPQTVTAGDFNDDGHADLAAMGTLAMLVAYGNGDGTFEAPINIATGGGFFASAARDSLAEDVDGNGHPDILIAGSTLDGIGLVVFRSNGDDTFQPASTFPGSGMGDPLALADFNKDGFSDVVMANRSSNVFSLYRGNGDGTFQLPVTHEMGTNVYAITTADFDLDGNQDVATVSYGCTSCGAGAPDGGIAVRLGMGDGTFLDPMHYEVAQRPQFITAGDFNGDGRPDLAVTELLVGRVSVLLGVGDGSFQAPVGFALPGSSERVIVGDFNNDGRTDLAAGVFGAQAVALLWNACEASPPGLSLLTQPGSLQLSWPAVEGFELQATDELGMPGWDAEIPTPEFNNDRFEVSIPFDAPRRFFRLRRP